MDWVRGEKLGHGSSATVSLAVPKKQSPSLPLLMAVKSCGVSLSSSLKNERFILEELKDCPEIIRCFGESFTHENGQKLYNVLLEYASGGSLADRVKNSGDRKFPEYEVRGYTKALLKGLDYIHKFDYVHCDVKLQNILLCADGGVRIADFGLAKRAARRRTFSGWKVMGTPMYMSPEMVCGGEQGAPADIWALGCAVSEMAGGAPAWADFSDAAALMMRIGVGDQVPEIPGIMSDEGRDFLAKCFLKDPSQRWTAEMLLNHPFITRDQDFDGDSDDGAAALKDRREKTTSSTSPRCPFDLPDWVSTCSITLLPSPGYFRESELWFSDESSISTAAAQVGSLNCERGLDWSVSDEWVTVR
ncbi:hypothetical protein OROGR_007883 [Orobanche gracilis]